ncbi:uncharacterized protein LOC120250373 [Dioscorea cayenensis subsp. rotundata]|uniref:Uncharacterized protein LOC120250373 n=1 Tax=Dioscorea cayennensis subsp. rotundata TaxID=55577 RepID=A0AB40AJL4_DIOCR|nr:uncharacterized protein LOC120250373 [Dioscorea cayenensis subsp. rotundata]
MVVKLQSLQQGFENLCIIGNEGILDYVTHVGELVNQMRVFSDIVSEAMMVGKVLRSMGARYNHIVIVIEDSRDITKLTLDELTGSLSSYKACLISQSNQGDEKVLHVINELSLLKEVDRNPSRGRGKG